MIHSKLQEPTFKVFYLMDKVLTGELSGTRTFGSWSVFIIWMLIIWMSPFLVLEVTGEHFHFYFNSLYSHRNSCEQTVLIQISAFFGILLGLHVYIL